MKDPFPGVTLNLVLCGLPDLTDCWSYTPYRVAGDELKQTLRWLSGLSRVSKVGASSVRAITFGSLVPSPKVCGLVVSRGNLSWALV